MSTIVRDSRASSSRLKRGLTELDNTLANAMNDQPQQYILT